MTEWTIYYNPNCKTCQKTLAILKERRIDVFVRDYLKSPPTEKELNDVLTKLKMGPSEIIRKKDPTYDLLKLGSKEMTDAEWLSFLTKHPHLIERPIVIRGERAVMARPPERALLLLQ
jgi:arsenate reductase (glutaredoxin)